MQNLSSKNKERFAGLTKFEREVLHVLEFVPRGKVVSYGDLAKKIGNPQSSRAVGNALHKNPCAPKIPCHRVVKGNGLLGGFASGAKKKMALLKKEGIEIKKGKVVDFKKCRHFFK